MTSTSLHNIAAALVAQDQELAAIGPSEVVVVMQEMLTALRIVARSRAICPTSARTVEVRPGEEVAL